MKIWSELGQRLCIEGWHIDGIPDLSSGQEVPDLLSDLDSDVFLSFSGRGPEVRGKCDVLLAGEEGVVRGWRFVLVNIQGTARNMPRIDGGLECALVDKSSSCAIHHQATLVHQRQTVGVDDVPGIISEGDMQGDNISASECRIGRVRKLDLQFVGSRLSEKGIKSDNLHVESLRTLHKLTSDSAHTDDGEALSIHFDAGECFPRALEVTGENPRVCWRDIASGGEHERKGMLGRGYGVAGRRVHDDHPVGACCFPVYVIDSDSGSPDRAKSGSASDDLGVGLGLGTNNERVIIPNDLRQLIGLGAEVWDKVSSNVGMVVQEGDPMLTDGVRNEDTVTGHLIGVDLCQTRKKGKNRTALPPSGTAAGHFCVSNGPG